MRAANTGTRPSRRDFFRNSAAVGLGAFGSPQLWPLVAPLASDAKAKAVIQIFLQGGLSHLDTFDPKPDAPVEVRGPFRQIPTKLDGERFTELMRYTANVAQHLVVVRSMSHGEAAHERGTHNMITGYKPSPALTYPSLGSVVSHELGSQNHLPPYVCVPNARMQYVGTGYLGSAHGPFSLGSEPNSANYQVRDLAPQKGIDAQRIERRRLLLTEFDSGFDGRADAIDATSAFYDQAWKLIESEPARDAFRIDKEDPKLRDRYGRSNIGQRLLLARRLVQSGVRYVTVADGGYDNHQRIQSALRTRMRDLDRGFGNLIADLAASGLLDTTLVLLTTEFGRTPRLNNDSGRDHWPRVFSIVMAGGGLKRGVVVGRSDASGAEPEQDPVSPGDLAATVFTQLGVDPGRRLLAPGGRPIDIVREGRVMREIIA